MLEALLEPSANKYYFDQMHKYWDESLALKERAQKLVAALEEIIALATEHESNDQCGERDPYNGFEMAKIARKILNAAKGDF